MKIENPTIIWEKWIDPYGENLDEMAWPCEEEEEFLDTENYDRDTQELSEEAPIERHMKLLTTTQGIIPMLEHSFPSKVFKFWVGHNNFPITKCVFELIENTPGVETFDILSPIRFRISVGKAFRSHEVKADINNRIKEYFKQLNSTVFIKPKFETMLPNRRILSLSE